MRSRAIITTVSCLLLLAVPLVSSQMAVDIDFTSIYREPGYTEASIYLYEPGTSAIVFSGETGGYLSMPDGTYDLSIFAYDNNISVKMKGVDIAANEGSTILLDQPDADGTSFEKIYSVENGFSFESATFNIHYRDRDWLDERNLGLYECDNWDYQTRVCNTTWDSADATVYIGYNHIEFVVDSFSAYGVRQEGSCGDGICAELEDELSCAADCSADEPAVQTRLCSDNYLGLCAVGNETLVNGNWTGCPAPVEEECNYVDDDCDGEIDEGCPAEINPSDDDIHPLQNDNYQDNSSEDQNLPDLVSPIFESEDPGYLYIIYFISGFLAVIIPTIIWFWHVSKRSRLRLEMRKKPKK